MRSSLPVDQFKENLRPLKNVIHGREFRSYLSSKEIVEDRHYFLAILERDATQIVDQCAHEFVRINAAAQLRDVADRWLTASIARTEETVFQRQQALVNVLDGLDSEGVTRAGTLHTTYVLVVLLLFVVVILDRSEIVFQLLGMIRLRP